METVRRICLLVLGLKRLKSQRQYNSLIINSKVIVRSDCSQRTQLSLTHLSKVYIYCSHTFPLVLRVTKRAKQTSVVQEDSLSFSFQLHPLFCSENPATDASRN